MRIARSIAGFVLVVGSLAGSPTFAQPPGSLEGVGRVVFLGDSITYSGEYIAFVEAYLRLKNPGLVIEFLNLGLPSETVSGLSEPGHAGGSFPRPELSERLDRILTQLKPDLVVACYGMNDGIYYPFAEDRFRKYQDGLKSLRSRALASGAKVLHLTPPIFDPLPIRSRTLPAGLVEYRQPYEGYDEVLDRYSGWLLAQRSAGWDVVDVHGPMTRFVNQTRQRDPSFVLAADGVHLNATGHALIAREILLHWGVPAADLPEASSVESILKASPSGTAILDLVRRKQNTLKDAWLTATGHKRPGMSRGIPTGEAQTQANEIDRKIRELLKAGE